MIFGLVALFSLPMANVANWFLFPSILEYPFINRFEMAGFSFYSGMLSFLIFSAIFLKIFKYNVYTCINTVIPSLLIFHAFGRVGCSLAGCCYGRPIMPITFSGLTMDRFPARETEAILLFILFFLFQFRIKNNRLSIYLLSYSTIRFFIEFGRGDDRGTLITSILSPAQITSIVIFAVTIIYYCSKFFFKKGGIIRIKGRLYKRSCDK